MCVALVVCIHTHNQALNDGSNYVGPTLGPRLTVALCEADTGDFHFVGYLRHLACVWSVGRLGIPFFERLRVGILLMYEPSMMRLSQFPPLGPKCVFCVLTNPDVATSTPGRLPCRDFQHLLEWFHARRLVKPNVWCHGLQYLALRLSEVLFVCCSREGRASAYGSQRQPFR